MPKKNQKFVKWLSWHSHDVFKSHFYPAILLLNQFHYCPAQPSQFLTFFLLFRHFKKIIITSFDCYDIHLTNHWSFIGLLRYCLPILYSICIHIVITGFQLISIKFEAHLSHNICFLCTLAHERPYSQSMSMLK